MADKKPKRVRSQIRRDTAANWESQNPILLAGEEILVYTNAGETRRKIGDGAKTYTQLPFDDERIYNALNDKQSKVTGNSSQIVGFNTNGAMEARSMPTAAELGAEPSGSAYLAQVNAEAHADSAVGTHNTDVSAHSDIRSAVAAKQDKLTGTQGQFVGFDAAGSPAAMALPETELPDATTAVKGVTMLSDSVTSAATDRAATPKAVKQAYDLASGKQDAITGTKGQIVGFDSDGKPVAQAAPETGVTSFKGRSGAVTPASGDYTAQMVGALPLAGGILTGDVGGTGFSTTAHETATVEPLPGVTTDYDVDHTAQLADGRLHVGVTGTVKVTPSSGSATTNDLNSEFTFGAAPTGFPVLSLGTNLSGENIASANVSAQYLFTPYGNLQVTYTDPLSGEKKTKVFGEKFAPYQTDGGVWVTDDFCDSAGNSVHIYDVYFKVFSRVFDSGGHPIDTILACKRLTGNGTNYLNTDGVSGNFDAAVSFVAQQSTNYYVGIFAKLNPQDTVGYPFYQHTMSIIGWPASGGQSLSVSMSNPAGSVAVLNFTATSSSLYSLGSVNATGIFSRYLLTTVGEALS